MVAIVTPHTRGAGYFLNNQNQSVNDGRQEADIATCKHCQAVIKLQLWKEDGGFCGKCMAPICGPCADRMLTHGCEPFIKKIEAAYNNAVSLAAHRKLVGLDAPPADFVPKIIVGAHSNGQRR
jgi:Zn ribbon nucleic-acid-binding protein